MDTYNPLNGAPAVLPDKRLCLRLQTMVDCFSTRPDCTIPEATSDRNDMDAAYNFYKNAKVTPGGVVATCLDYTLANLQGCSRVLVIQDSTDLNYSALHDTSGLGYTDGPNTRGLKLHSSLAVGTDGLVAGLLTQQIWTRPFQSKGRAQQRRQRQAIDKESFRWQDHAQQARDLIPEDVLVLHVADREGDIYDWFAAKRSTNTHLLVRVAQAHRVVVDDMTGKRGSLADVVATQPVLGQQVITVPRADERPQRQATLSIRVAPVKLQPPRHASQRSSLVEVAAWVVEAVEEKPAKGVKPIHWRLVTTEAINKLEDAVRTLREYVLRWLIERFHFVCKSGFGIERLQLTRAERLANAVAVYSQAAVRVMRLAYLARVEPEAEASREFTEEEVKVLEAEGQRRKKGATGPLRSIKEAVAVLARLGGHLGRKGDGPPGVKVLWRGLKALHYMILGFRIGQNRSPSSSIYP